jgi:DNA-binding HxlR family transcriptional regulator
MVARRRFDGWPCPIARTVDLTGDHWTPLVMREAFLGRRRFDEFVAALEIPRAALADRLDRLVDAGLLRRVPYGERPVRHEYRLTDAGFAFYDVLGAMWRFGSDWLYDNPFELYDRETGARVEPRVVDGCTGEPLDVRRLRIRERPAPVRPE